MYFKKVVKYVPVKRKKMNYQKYRNSRGKRKYRR